MGRRIGGLAVVQLALWEAIARNWPVSLIKRETGTHLTCRLCDVSVLPVDDNHADYLLTADIMIAAIVAHLRNVHRDLDPDKGDNS